jgi:hypothetical protein
VPRPECYEDYLLKLLSICNSHLLELFWFIWRIRILKHGHQRNAKMIDLIEAVFKLDISNMLLTIGEVYRVG